jgi:hypothetical protein
MAAKYPRVTLRRIQVAVVDNLLNLFNLLNRPNRFVSLFVALMTPYVQNPVALKLVHLVLKILVVILNKKMTSLQSWSSFCYLLCSKFQV